jgi:hypothetical protein
MALLLTSADAITTYTARRRLHHHHHHRRRRRFAAAMLSASPPSKLRPIRPANKINSSHRTTSH